MVLSASHGKEIGIAKRASFGFLSVNWVSLRLDFIRKPRLMMISNHPEADRRIAIQSILRLWRSSRTLLS